MDQIIYTCIVFIFRIDSGCKYCVDLIIDIVFIFRIDGGKFIAVNKLDIDEKEFGNIVDLTHYDTGTIYSSPLF